MSDGKSKKILETIINAIKPTVSRDKWALVLEGGAMRCIYTSGVLDALHENCFNKFDYIIGVSAGGACAASFMTGQKGRSQNIFTNYLTTKQFVSFSRIFDSDKSIMDLQYALKEISEKLVPLQLDALKYAYPEFYLTVTRADNGKADYLRVNSENAVDALVASCSLPYLTREPAECEGSLYVDGGVSDPIPIKQALALGANKIVVVTTRPQGFRKKKKSFMTSIMKKIFVEFNQLEELISSEHEVNNHARHYMENFDVPGVDLFVVSPPQNFVVDRLTSDKSTLLTGYAQGVISGMKIEKKLKRKMRN